MGRLIEAFFREFMELFCPDEARQMDFSRVEFLRKEQSTDTRRGKRGRRDMAAKVGLAGVPPSCESEHAVHAAPG